MIRNLGELVRTAKKYGQVMFQAGDVLVSEDNAFYDTRTKVDLATGIHFVKPITFEDGYYNYICPDCCEVHPVHKSKVYTLINTGCCAARSHSNRDIWIGGKRHKLKRAKIRMVLG